MPIIFLEEPLIHRAARLGDIAALEQLVASGADINAPTDIAEDQGTFLEQLTPLMVAACSIDGASVETLVWLLEHGADLYRTSAAGVTAAWYAAGSGDFQNVRPWHMVKGQVERLRFLLDAGLDAYETAENGRSLLIEACNAGDPERVQLLLERGLSPLPQVPEKIPDTSE